MTFLQGAESREQIFSVSRYKGRNTMMVFLLFLPPSGREVDLPKAKTEGARVKLYKRILLQSLRDSFLPEEAFYLFKYSLKSPTN